MLFTPSEASDVEISRRELGFPKDANFIIHKFPVKYEGHMSEICKTENIGGIFAGRFDFISDVANNSNLSLTGQDSIFGRSLRVVDQNNKVLACATIKSSSTTKTVVSVFRAVSPGISGTIVLRQSMNNPESVTAVDINLMLVDARSEALNGLSFAVYESAPTSNTAGSCKGIGAIFNPLGKTSCDKREHNTCPIGDLSAKLGPLKIPLPGKGDQHKFHIDTNLPLSGDNSIVGRSLVILSNGKPLICTKIQEFQKMSAEVMLDQGLSGIIAFTQESLYEPVMVNVSGRYDGITVYEHVSRDSSCSVGRVGKQLALIKGEALITMVY